MKKWKWFSFTAALIFLFSLFAMSALADEAGGQEPSPLPLQLLYLKGYTVYLYDSADNTSKEIFTVEDGDQCVLDYEFKDGKVKQIKKSFAQKVFLNTGFSPNQKYLYSYRDGVGSSLTLWDLAHPDNPPAVLGDNHIKDFSFLNDQTLLYSEYGGNQSSEDTWFIYDLADGQQKPGQLKVEEGSLAGDFLAFSPSGSLGLWEEWGRFGDNRKLYSINLENLNAGKKLLLSDYSSVDHVSDDLMTLYYEMNGEMYCLKGLSKQIELTKNYNDFYDSFYIIDGTDNAYYSQRGEPVYVTDFIDDDLPESDAKMEEPDTDDMDWDESDITTENEWRKMFRDDLRQIAFMSTTEARRDLYYFNGEDSIKVNGNSNVTTYEQIENGRDIFSGHIICPLPQPIKMSEITDSQTFSSAEKLLDSIDKTAFITEGKWFPIPLSEGSSLKRWNEVGLDEEERLLYYVEVPNKGNGKNTVLKAVPYTPNGLGEPAAVDQSVDGLLHNTGETVFYKKCPTNQLGGIDLYSKGELIANNVFAEQYYDGYLYYWMPDGSSYLLCRYGKGKNEPIMASARRFSPLGDDYAAVITEGDKEGQGDLYLWNSDGSKILIAKDVEEASGMMTFD